MERTRNSSPKLMTFNLKLARFWLKFKPTIFEPTIFLFLFQLTWSAWKINVDYGSLHARIRLRSICILYFHTVFTFNLYSKHLDAFLTPCLRSHLASCPPWIETGNSSNNLLSQCIATNKNFLSPFLSSTSRVWIHLEKKSENGGLEWIYASGNEDKFTQF